MTLDEKKERVKVLAEEIYSILKTDVHELNEDYSTPEGQWQASAARVVASMVLSSSNASGLGGCSLCQG